MAGEERRERGAVRDAAHRSCEPSGWGGGSVGAGGAPGVGLVLTARLLRAGTPVLPLPVVALRRSRLGLCRDVVSTGDCRAQGLRVGSSRRGPEVRGSSLPVLVLTGSVGLAVGDCTPGSSLQQLGGVWQMSCGRSFQPGWCVLTGSFASARLSVALRELSPEPGAAVSHTLCSRR